MAQMRAFYLTWPAHQILQTPSAKSPPTAIRQTLSGESGVTEISESLSRKSVDLAISKGLSLNFSDDHEMQKHAMVMCDAPYAWCADTQLKKVARMLELK